MAIRVNTFTRIAGTTLAALVLGTGAAAPGAAQAADDLAPQGAVGGLQSPVRGALALTVDAVDYESGLSSVSALVDGALAQPVRLGTGCPIDDPVAQPGGCTRKVSALPLPIDFSAAALGDHRLVIRLYDAAGNASTLFDGSITVAGPEPVSNPTATIVVGDPRPAATPTPTPASTQGPGQGGTLSGSTSQPVSGCASPRLSAYLDERPVRVQRGKPVLRANVRYRFRGRLTCLVGNKRRSAPSRTPVEILYRVGKRTTPITGATTTTKGKFSVILAYPSARTLIFRHRSTVGGSSTVTIPFFVTKKKR